MTLEELKERLDELQVTQNQKNIPVAVCDLSDDSDESFILQLLKHVDVIKIGNREVVALGFES